MASAPVSARDPYPRGRAVPAPLPGWGSRRTLAEPRRFAPRPPERTSRQPAHLTRPRATTFHGASFARFLTIRRVPHLPLAGSGMVASAGIVRNEQLKAP